MRKDADTDALKERERLNARRSTRDFDAWVLEQVDPRPGHHVLDLGCGVGKQSFLLASRVLPGGTVTGLDVSPPAVAEVNSRAQREGLAHVTALTGELDDLPGPFSARRFDRIISCYAMYYARDMRAVMIRLRESLADRGTLFACGPGAGTNREMIELVASLGGRAVPIADWLTEGDLQEIGSRFRHATVARLENEVRLDSPAEVMTWWSNHNSHVPELADAVRERLHDCCRVRGGFPLAKNVLGVRFDA